MEMLDFPNTEGFRISSDVSDDQMIQWLHDRGVPYQTRVYVLLNDQYERVLVMPWKLVIKYWEALQRHSSYALIITSMDARWACLFNDDEYVEFGSYLPE